MVEYSGGKINYGYLVGLIDTNGNIDMHYQQINEKDELMADVFVSQNLKY